MTRLFGAGRALVVGVSLGCTSSTSSVVPTPSTITWVQVWSDEFDGPAGGRVDDTKWRYETTDGCAQGNCGWGNNEKEHYTDAAENIALNGKEQLTIVARNAPA